VKAVSVEIEMGFSRTWGSYQQMGNALVGLWALVSEEADMEKRSGLIPRITVLMEGNLWG